MGSYHLSKLMSRRRGTVMHVVPNDVLNFHHRITRNPLTLVLWQFVNSEVPRRRGKL